MGMDWEEGAVMSAISMPMPGSEEGDGDGEEDAKGNEEEEEEEEEGGGVAEEATEAAKGTEDNEGGRGGWCCCCCWTLFNRSCRVFFSPSSVVSPSVRVRGGAKRGLSLGIHSFHLASHPM